jgi:hypothetical protein
MCNMTAEASLPWAGFVHPSLPGQGRIDNFLPTAGSYTGNSGVVRRDNIVMGLVSGNPYSLLQV